MQFIPDIVGVRIPSPITMLVPRRTTSSNTTRELWCFSINSFMTKLVLVSFVGVPVLQEDKR